MKPAELEELKRNFLVWSGGFPPDSPEQVTVCVDHARHADIDPTATRDALVKWMQQESATANRSLIRYNAGDGGAILVFPSHPFL